MATMNDVAREAGMSRYTVSKVFNGDTLVREENRRRVLEACERLGYTRNEHAFNLVRGESRTIGLITPQITDTFFGEIIEAAEETARELGYQLVYECSYENAEDEAETIRSLQALRVCGIVAAPVVTEANLDLWRQLEREVRMVFKLLYRQPL